MLSAVKKTTLGMYYIHGPTVLLIIGLLLPSWIKMPIATELEHFFYLVSVE